MLFLVFCSIDPFISYNNATYFPMTYRNKESLGLTSKTESGTIYFTTGNTPSYSADIEGTSKGKKKTPVGATTGVFA